MRSPSPLTTRVGRKGTSREPPEHRQGTDRAPKEDTEVDTTPRGRRVDLPPIRQYLAHMAPYGRPARRGDRGMNGRIDGSSVEASIGAGLALGAGVCGRQCGEGSGGGGVKGKGKW